MKNYSIIVLTVSFGLLFSYLLYMAKTVEDSGIVIKAKMTAQAEVERAKGIAEANRIVGDSLRDNEQYLRYLWIQSLANTKNQVVYVPTEGGTPILEGNTAMKLIKGILK